MRGANHLLPHAFMAYTGKTLHDMILLVIVISFFADFGFVFNGSI